MKVSVIIPAYNAAGFLERAVASVQAQTLQDFEIIIVDDVSPDTTLGVAKALAKTDKRISVIAHSVNGGPSAARNAGFAAAKGQWLAILDADDAWLPERLEKLLEAAQKHQLDMVADDLLVYDADAQQTAGKALNLPKAHIGMSVEYYLENDFSGGLYSLSIIKPMFNRAFIEKHKLAYPTRYRHGEDSYFYTLVLLAGGRIGIIPEAYYLYTATVGPISGKRSALSQTQVDFAKKAQSCADILEAQGARMSPGARALLLRRQKRNESLNAFQLAKRLKIDDLAQYVFRHPHVVVGMPVAVLGKILNKLSA